MNLLKNSLHDSNIFGAGLRAAHYSFWHEIQDLPILELMADNYMYLKGGPALYHLELLKGKGQFVVHSVGMNIGAAYAFNEEYCQILKKFCDKVNPLVVSDHLCFTASPTHNSFDLLPIPYTTETLQLLCERIDCVQNILGRQFCLENISSYVSYNKSTYSELEFLNELCKRSGCGVLLDINNLYVSGKNHEYNYFSEIEKINPNFVKQYHIAGHSQYDDFLFDTHDTPVCSEVWELMQFAFKIIGKRPVIIERDDDSCPFSELIADIHTGNRLICNL